MLRQEAQAGLSVVVPEASQRQGQGFDSTPTVEQPDIAYPLESKEPCVEQIQTLHVRRLGRAATEGLKQTLGLQQFHRQEAPLVAEEALPPGRCQVTEGDCCPSCKNCDEYLLSRMNPT